MGHFFLTPGHLRETHLTLLHPMIRVRALQVLAVRDDGLMSGACMVVFQRLLSLSCLELARRLHVNSSLAASN